MKYVWLLAVFLNSTSLGFCAVQGRFLWAGISLLALVVCIHNYNLEAAK